MANLIEHLCTGWSKSRYKMGLIKLDMICHFNPFCVNIKVSNVVHCISESKKDTQIGFPIKFCTAVIGVVSIDLGTKDT